MHTLTHIYMPKCKHQHKHSLTNILTLIKKEGKKIRFNESRRVIREPKTTYQLRQKQTHIYRHKNTTKHIQSEIHIYKYIYIYMYKCIYSKRYTHKFTQKTHQYVHTPIYVHTCIHTLPDATAQLSI